MRKTNITAIVTTEPITVNIDTLQKMLCVGKNNAAKIGEDANAVVCIGRRRLYNVKRIRNYIDSISGNTEDEE
ncbi:MAG: hypothetical protein IKF50_00855 [Clostridia bacterium]|nr:hypothetical protein [Clostridia bacterium]